MKRVAAMSRLLALLALSDSLHAQSTSASFEYVNRGRGTYATKYFFDKKGSVRHVTLIGNGNSGKRSTSNFKRSNDRHRPATWSIRHGNSTYRMDAMGNIVGGSKQIGNRTYNLRKGGKTGSYATRIGNTVYYRNPEGTIKSITIYWNNKRKK